jgi:DNA processing protein
MVLYVRGDAAILNAPSLSIVGTRRPTVYGTQMAERTGRDLAKRGLAVISGLAGGIDAIAHEGATSLKGPGHRGSRNGIRYLLSQGE